MKLAVRFSSLFALLALLGALPAVATTYQMVQDPLLADQARAIADVRVTQVESPAADAKGNPVTDYVVQVERVLKGQLPGSTVVVRVPGGIAPNGIGVKIWGAPAFAPGERALLFLNPAGDGTFRILHLMLGAFHQRTLAGRSVALRDLSEAHEVTETGVTPGKDETRDFERFAGWLADRAEGIARARDYVVSGQASGGLGQAVQPFTYITGDDDKPIRWFTFDEGRSVSWRVNSAGQSGIGLDATVAAFKTAIQAWNGDTGSNVRYSYAGLTEASSGTGRGDGTNAILFDDPNGQVEGSFACPGGGVIALGGPRFLRATRDWNGQEAHEAVEGDIVTNDGTDCFFSRRALAAEEVFAHELGHTLGLGHSQDTEALMYAFAHADGRGARLIADDKEAIASLYPSDGQEPPPAGGPAAPTGLAARLEGNTSVVLTWTDKSNDETGFRVERKINSGKFREILSLPAGTTTATVTGLQAGTTYGFRVRAVNGDGFSGYSNTASVTIPATPPLTAPTNLVAVAHSGTEVYLSWRETAQGETNFRIERSTAGGAFQEVGTAPANAQGALITGLTPGVSYTFRVRAAGAAGFSAYSNAAAATTPTSSPAEVCGENGPSLCLLGSRFRVEVDWHQGNGTTGRGTLVRSSDKTATVWFFDPGNTELIVKVLDGRPVNQQFWVFFSSLTDLEFWIQVTDTQTGLVRVYHNRAGDVRGMADTSAFPAALPTQPAPSPIREVRTFNPSPVAPVAETGPAQSPSACVTGPNALCLGSRFQVEVTWRNASNGAIGTAGAIPGIGSTGYFWFFDPENVELVVKVLDGTALNGKFWVFYGSLSDVESWVKVTDTQTGKVKTYHNMPGSLANLADTSAF